MASTNKTANYDLSQYVGTDKPTYLNDYNSDMLKIDEGIHDAQVKADEIGDLTNLLTDNKNNIVSAINEVDTHADNNATATATNTNAIGTLTNLETTNKNNLVSAINEVNTFKNNFDLNNSTPYAISDLVASNINVDYCDLQLVTNSDNSLYKLYGLITGNVSNVGSSTITIQSDLRPSEEYSVNCAGSFVDLFGNTYMISPVMFTVKTTGEIVIGIFNNSTGAKRLILNPCLFFNTSFGDNPQ